MCVQTLPPPPQAATQRASYVQHAFCWDYGAISLVDGALVERSELCQGCLHDDVMDGGGSVTGGDTLYCGGGARLVCADPTAHPPALA